MTFNKLCILLQNKFMLLMMHVLTCIKASCLSVLFTQPSEVLQCEQYHGLCGE